MIDGADVVDDLFDVERIVCLEAGLDLEDIQQRRLSAFDLAGQDRLLAVISILLDSTTRCPC